MLQYYMPNISHLSPYPGSVGVFQDYQTAPYLNLHKQDGYHLVESTMLAILWFADEDLSQEKLTTMNMMMVPIMM